MKYFPLGFVNYTDFSFGTCRWFENNSTIITENAIVESYTACPPTDAKKDSQAVLSMIPTANTGKLKNGDSM